MAIELEFLRDMTIALAMAVIGGYAASALRLSPIVGYLAAGIIVSPATPGITVRTDLIEGLAQLGLIFLLFSLGLGFSLSELRQVGKLGYVEIALLVLLGAGMWLACLVARYPHPLTMGITMIVSSTAIGVALLRQWDLEHHRVGILVISIAVIEDLVAVALVVLASTDAKSASVATVGLEIGKAIGFVLLAILFGRFVLQPLTLRLIQNAPANALFGTFTAIALICAWAGHAAGLSFEFGAFIAGAVVSEAAGSRMVQSIVAPFRELFVSLFFVSVGMLFDPALVFPQWIAVIAIGLVFVALRWSGFTLLGMIGGLPRNLALLFGMALVPLGEFNIVLINESFATGRVSKSEQAGVLGIVFFTIGFAMLSGPLLKGLAAKARSLTGARAAAAAEHGEAPEVDAVIIGYGRVGKTVCGVLHRAHIRFGVIEQQRTLVAAARNDGCFVLEADATDPAAIERMIGNGVRVVISTVRDESSNASIARRLSGTTKAAIITRAQRTAEIPELIELGSNEAIVPEVEGAFAFGEAALRGLGFNDEDIGEVIHTERASLIATSHHHHTIAMKGRTA